MDSSTYLTPLTGHTAMGAPTTTAVRLRVRAAGAFGGAGIARSGDATGGATWRDPV